MNKPTLYIFSGLPASGKSTLAKALAAKTGAVFLRIDTIEQALRDLCELNVEGEGYGLAYRVAVDNLKLGLDVVADSCNPIELTRKEWSDVAINNDAHFINIEIICSDKAEHKQRIETRTTDVEGLKLPTWECVENREYHDWQTNRIVIDTANQSVPRSVQALIDALGKKP